MALNYSSKHDISYANYNNKNIPWKLNASIISQNNQTINPSLNLGAINNNLVIESSQNDILFFTSQNENKKVIVKNNMAINNLDVSNNLKTKLIDSSSISLNNILYFPSLPINIIGDLKVYGVINVIGSSKTGLAISKTQFINSTLRTSKFTDVSIVECDISDSSFNNVNIINSYIYNIPNGYGFDKSNNSYPNKANFSDVSLQRLVLDSSLNSYINFAANANSDNSIIIRSYDDYSKLKINKPLNIGIGETISNISNVSIFYGTISCNTLYYSQLVPDIRLNTYFDVSIGLVSISGNNIPVNNSFNIGSSDYKFNEIISTQFSGDLSGTATIANDLRKNLDMSFNNLDIYGTFTLNRQNLNQFLSGDLISIIAADISFINANTKVHDLSTSLYSKTGFDLCLNSNFTKISLRDASFVALNNKITSISNNVYSKSDFDLCLNRNILSVNDVSAIVAVVTNPTQIYPMLGYIDNSLIKQTNAKVSNELAFPYAITYIDDLVEDTNLKESYSYRKTTTETTITRTTEFDTITPYTYTIVDSEPIRVTDNVLFMRAYNINAYVPTIKTWNADDPDRTGPKPAVYRVTPAISSGGTLKISNSYICHIFTESGKFVPRFSGNIEVLLVGGGGGGSSGLGGGGGGGGVVWITSTSVTAGNIYDIIVGNGGGPNTNGSNTRAFGATAAGGGRGVNSGSGIDGGCGGGVGGNNNVIGDNYIFGGAGGVGNVLGSNNSGYTYGRNGGIQSFSPNSHRRGSGGGGSGLNAPETTYGGEDTGYNGSGAGGTGVEVGILRDPIIYRWGGGGGGAAVEGSYAPFVRPVGGYGGHGGGGGGAGQTGGGLAGPQSYGTGGTSGGNGLFAAGGNGGPNTGGGGGGAYQGPGGSGGSGIVIISYQRTTTTLGSSNSYSYILDDSVISWEQHRTRTGTLSGNGITITLASISSINDNDAVYNIAIMSVKRLEAYIGGRRKANSSATGRSSNDWEWVDNSSWNYENFYRGYPEKTEGTPSNTDTRTISTIPGQPTIISSGGLIDFSATNVKLPQIVCSTNGYIVVTATAISTLSIPSNPNPSDGASTPISSNTGPATEYTNYRITTTRLVHTYTRTTITYSLNSGLATGSFKISDNSNNSKNYIKSSASALPTTIPINYSCIAVTDDGMFVALGKANNVTVYMRTSNGWTILGSPISGVNFTAYTNTDCNILWNGFDSSMYKNLQNLAINYISGSNVLDLYLAFGDARSSVKLYSYNYSGTSVLSNGFYTVSTTGTWVTNTSRTRTPNSALGETSNTNFGYFVTLSHNPILLGFTVDDKFYTYSTSTNGLLGSRKTLEKPNVYSASTKNIVAFKMSSDADKIIVSNTYYVFIYKWDTSTIDWSLLRTISLLSTTNNPIITFTYGTSSNKIAAAPRSLDIRNISTNECVFAIGFPDVLIDISNNRNRKVRGYVEYWKLINDTLTRLSTLEPRKRNIDSSNVDTDEYFFSAGGIKITNANTILVAPNFKFHFNSTNKNYTLDTSNLNWTDHNTKAKLISGREIASIENEIDNEFVKISARNNVVWIGAKRTALDVPSGITSTHWQWSDLSSTWNYTSFASGQPNNFSEKRIQSLSGSWSGTMETVTSRAVYMTRSLSYSLNTFNLFDRFYFHSSGFTSSYANTDISSTVIAKWVRTDSPSTQPIEFRGNGDLKRTSQGIFTISDIRLKENIVDASPKLEDLLKVRVVNYNLKGCKDAKLIGVVAQELEQIFPALVKDGDLSQHDIYLGKTESYKSVKYSCFDVMLIKAFQEQMAIINKLSSQLDEQEKKCKLLKIISQGCVILKQELDLLKRENELFKLTINEILKLI